MGFQKVTAVVSNFILCAMICFSTVYMQSCFADHEASMLFDNQSSDELVVRFRVILEAMVDGRTVRSISSESISIPGKSITAFNQNYESQSPARIRIMSIETSNRRVNFTGGSLYTRTYSNDGACVFNTSTIKMSQSGNLNLEGGSLVGRRLIGAAILPRHARLRPQHFLTRELSDLSLKEDLAGVTNPKDTEGFNAGN